MKINRALGLGLVLLILQFLASGIWVSLEATIVKSLDVAQTALGAAEQGIEQMPIFPTVSPFPTQ